jgi:chromosome partitioning protein
MAVPSIAEIQAHIAAIQARAAVELRGMVITVWSSKGGVGKTMLAMELAQVLGATLVDLDWDDGNASRAMGYYHERYTRAPLIDAIEKQQVPTLWRRNNRPPLVPGHPDFENAKVPSDVIRDCLILWAKELDTVLVADTHPGQGDSQFGAVSAAEVVGSPAKLATRELDALEGELRTLEGYPIYLVPNRVNPKLSTNYEVSRLAELAKRFGVPLGPVIREYVWLERRRLSTMVTATEPSKTTLPFIWDIVRVAEGVLDYATAS